MVFNFEPSSVIGYHDYGTANASLHGYSEKYGGYVAELYLYYDEFSMNASGTIKLYIEAQVKTGELLYSPGRLVIVNIGDGPLEALGVNTDGYTTGNGSLSLTPGDEGPVFIMLNKMANNVSFDVYTDGESLCILYPVSICQVGEGLYAAEIRFPSYEAGANYKITVLDGDRMLYGVVYSVTYFEY